MIFNMVSILCALGALLGGSSTILADESLKAPFMVSIRDKNNTHRCGGALITERAVLTSSECVRDQVLNLNDILLVIGTNLAKEGLDYLPQNLNEEIHSETLVVFINGKRVDQDRVSDFMDNSIHRELNTHHDRDEGSDLHLMKDKEKAIIDRLQSNQVFKANKIYTHIGYNGEFMNNIAIIKLNKKVDLSSQIRTIPINRDNSALNPGDELKLYGWDEDLIKSNPIGEISKIPLHVMHQNKCIKIYEVNFKNDSELCLYGQKHIPGIGFSGSPIIKNNILYGVVSYGGPLNNSMEFIPTVGVNLASYNSFITNVLEKINDEQDEERPFGFFNSFNNFFSRIFLGMHAFMERIFSIF